MSQRIDDLLAAEAGAGAGDDRRLALQQTVAEYLRMGRFSHRRASLYTSAPALM